MNTNRTKYTNPIPLPEITPPVDFPESQQLLDLASDPFAGIDPEELSAYLSGCDHKIAAYEAKQAEKLAAARHQEFLEDNWDDYQAELAESR